MGHLDESEFRWTCLMKPVKNSWVKSQVWVGESSIKTSVSFHFKKHLKPQHHFQEDPSSSLACPPFRILVPRASLCSTGRHRRRRRDETAISAMEKALEEVLGDFGVEKARVSFEESNMVKASLHKPTLSLLNVVFASLVLSVAHKLICTCFMKGSTLHEAMVLFMSRFIPF